MSNELANFCLGHFIRVPFVVEKDETSYPADVGPLGAQAEVLNASDSPHLIEQFWGRHYVKTCPILGNLLAEILKRHEAERDNITKSVLASRIRDIILS